MGDVDKVTILNRTGPGSTPQEPLALLAKVSDSGRSDLKFGGRGGPAEPPEIRYLYYLLYAHADIFADLSCDTIPLEEGHISILRTDDPGLSLNEPMAIVQVTIVQVESPSISDGRYLIKNRAANIYWNAGYRSIKTVLFLTSTLVDGKERGYLPVQVNERSRIIQVFKG